MRLQITEQIVDAQIDRLSGLRFHWLGFPSLLEDRFEADTSHRRCMRLWLEGLIAIALFDLFLFADHLGTPQDFLRALLVRLGIVTPLALWVNVSMLRRPGKVFREASIAAVASLAGLTHLSLEAGKSPTSSAYAQFGILAVILFANTFMRLQVPYALATSAVVFGGDLVFLFRDALLTPHEKIVGLYLTVSTLLVTVVSNYSSNREERLGYLLRLRGELKVTHLNRSNEHLSRMATSDALTGLANRHFFDRRFQQLWQAAAEQGTELAVILADVDRFKNLNDRFGHLYGDEALKRIATLILEALRVQGDFAARFGGEEFVILLPNTTPASAELVAERIRKLIEVAGLPPLPARTAPGRSALLAMSLTISCGVATAWPAAKSNSGPGSEVIGAEDRQRLLDAADRALYRAKNSGRNRVCVYSPEPSEQEAPGSSRFH